MSVFKYKYFTRYSVVKHLRCGGSRSCKSSHFCKITAVALLAYFLVHPVSQYKQLSDIVKSSDQAKQEAQLLLGDRATRKHVKDSWNGRGNDKLGWSDLQMYFKVIKSGTNEKLVYDFLLVVYSNFCLITHRFWENWCETVQWPWICIIA